MLNVTTYLRKGNRSNCVIRCRLEAEVDVVVPQAIDNTIEMIAKLDALRHTCTKDSDALCGTKSNASREKGTVEGGFYSDKCAKICSKIVEHKLVSKIIDAVSISACVHSNVILTAANLNSHQYVIDMQNEWNREQYSPEEHRHSQTWGLNIYCQL
ncbi:hypothetical protein EVAR_39598_1 [Eumeta japonica]|uniref:Uncharacterized protein n=1 Tax=Eumeta variegata TaxID=151549 RepID=A0A4C1Y6F8_EUMVA|nr:hypothetical protein EVAR_39598_1 [Eumeta japonica]